jgi:serine/threonine-protein kinase
MLAELRRVAVRLEVPRVPPPVPPARPSPEDTLPVAPVRLPAGGGTGAHPAVAPGGGPGGTRTMPRPPGLEPEHAHPAYAGHGGTAEGPSPHLRARRRSRRVFAAWTAIVLVLALVVGLTAWWLGVGRWTAMPSVIGLEQSTAQQLLGEADLVARVTQAHDDGVAAGLVSGANPVPQSRLLRGSVVELTVSTGRPAVPAITPGTAVADAEQAIRDAGLTPVRTTGAAEYSTSVPEGTVVRTDPGAGAALPVGGQVTLVVSRGAPPQPQRVRVPFLIGDRFDEAADELRGLGLEADENRTGFPFQRRNGRVVNQAPGPNSLVDPGTTIRLDTI